jgi:beta-lactamase class A
MGPLPKRLAATYWAAMAVVVFVVGCSGIFFASAAGAAGSGRPALLTPLDGEASFGDVVARAPAGARDAVLLVGGRWAARVKIDGGVARFTSTGHVGPSALTVRFLKGEAVVGTVAAKRVWLLPRSGAVAVAARGHDAELSERLHSLARAFPGWAGVYVQDLVSGRVASWNADAIFMAASTVKLGVLVETLRRFGPLPERSSVWSDLVQMVTVSSNEAANRLLLRVGGGSEREGTRLVENRFRALGAISTTYWGLYRGVLAHRADAPSPPPILTWRHTTPHDLARVLFGVQGAALEQRDALRRTGLTVHEARLALALLLDAKPGGGPLAGALRSGTPVAQKTGWLDKARSTAAIVYASSGPHLVVVMTYRPAINGGAASRLAQQVVAALGVGL